MSSQAWPLLQTPAEGVDTPAPSGVGQAEGLQQAVKPHLVYLSHFFSALLEVNVTSVCSQLCTEAVLAQELICHA